MKHFGVTPPRLCGSDTSPLRSRRKADSAAAHRHRRRSGTRCRWDHAGIEQSLARRTPDLVGAYDAFSGGIDAIRDGDIATRAASDIAGQRLSFSLAGPTGPAGATTIAGVHAKQLAQLGTAGPTGIVGFLRMGGVDYDAASGTPSADLPSPVYSSWDLNPADSSSWTSATLPAEAGIVSS